jgi:hypothetical protein
MGTQGALGLGQIGTQTGGLVGNALGFGANAQGAANIAGGNAVAGSLNDIFQGLGQSRTQSSFGGTPNGSGGLSNVGSGFSGVLTG